MIRVQGEPIERVTEKAVNVTERRKRGRPRKADAMTPAQKQKAYRERRKAKA